METRLAYHWPRLSRRSMGSCIGEKEGAHVAPHLRCLEIGRLLRRYFKEPRRVYLDEWT